MKLKISGVLLLKLSCYLSLAISFLPIVDFYCPWYVTVIPVMIAILVTMLMEKNIYPLLVTGTAVFGLACFSFWVVYRNNSFVQYCVDFFIAFIPTILAVQIGQVIDDKQFYRDYMRALALFTAITCVTTIIGLNMYPMASRELASGTAVYDTDPYRRINIGGYEFIYALVLLIPVLFWMIDRSRGVGRLAAAVVLVLDIACIYASQYTLALLCCVIALLIVWLFKNRKVGGVVMSAFVLLLLFNGFSMLGQFFYWASDVVGQEYVSDRLLQVAQLLSGQNVSTDTSDARIMHYANQLRAFWDSPAWGHNLIGYDSERISGHSQILDILGGAGLIGLSVLISLVRTLYQRVIRSRNGYVAPAVKQVWLLAIIVAALNPVYFSIIITVAFMCCLCIQKTEVGGS